jgi:TonB-dependent SusC/RagA subfamily outer membrane receptor
MGFFNRQTLQPFLALGALLVGGARASAAQQGSVAGQVTDQSSRQPVSGAQVLIIGTNLQGRTGREGRYTITKVPAGRHDVQVRFIGYATATQQVTVAAGEAVTLDFSLTPAAVPLDVVVVTGTGAEQLKRELGSSLPTIDASKTVEQALPTSVADLLNSRVPGVQVVSSSGTTGAGSRVRIRGSSSLSLTNEPIVIVDGIRVDNGATGVLRASSIGIGGQAPSRLNDLNPEEIESIEVVKGPSAAALYGTDAVNGVIQVRTKRGRPGPTRWTAFVEGGSVNEVTAWPANFTTVGDSLGAGFTPGDPCPLYIAAVDTICAISAVSSFNPLEVYSPFQTGSRQHYGLSASGGNEQTTFFTSGDFEREKGIYRPNDLRNVSLRANVRHQASRLLDVGVNVGYVSSDLGLPQNDNNSAGIASSGLLGFADSSINHGYGFLTPAQAFNIFVSQSVERFTGSINAAFRPTSFLTLRGVVGSDVNNRFDEQTIPPGIVPLNQNTLDGNRISNRTQILDYTANFTAEAAYRFSPAITSKTSVGFQYFKDAINQTQASGRKLVAGTGSLSGVVVPIVGENIDQFVTVGGYVEEQIGVRDRLYLTAAVRGDDNSAFGSAFNFITYPKVSASWVISEEPFFPRLSWLSSLRLRAAWGKSGRQPGPTDALQFFNPVAVATNNTDAPGVTDSSLGNKDLKPEKTQEYEAGFDADLLSQKVHFEFTYYDKKSKDALIAVRLPPSLGRSREQFKNLGEVSNKGVEIQATAQLIQRPNFGWSVTAGAWGNRNRLITFGDTAVKAIIFGLGGASQRHQAGFPLGGYWDFPYTFQDVDGDGLISAAEVTVGAEQAYQGTPFPTHGATLSTEVNFLKHFRLYGLFDGRWGNKLDNSTEEFRCEFGICEGMNVASTSLAQQAAGVAAVAHGIETGYFEDAGFVKLREVSLTYSAPSAWASRLGASGLSVTLTGRNLATWTSYTGADPELNNSGQTNFSTAEFLTQPPVRYFLARINLTF